MKISQFFKIIIIIGIIDNVNAKTLKWIPIIMNNTTIFVPYKNKIKKSNIYGKWQGTYTCTQGLTGLTLDIRRTTDNEVEAIFNFYAIPSNPYVPSGSYTMNGEYLEKSKLLLETTSWIDRPIGYMMVDLDGSFNASFTQYKGSVWGWGCTTFSLFKK